MTARAGTTMTARTRLALTAVVVALTVADLGLKAWAERSLGDNDLVDLGPIQLRLTHNPGVAFGLGDILPAAVVLTATGLIIAAIAVVAWRTVDNTPLAAALGVILAGAIGNFTDRAADGVVTDYLHTGWFPTFNGADILITLGAAALLFIGFRTEPDAHDNPPAADPATPPKPPRAEP